jgi:hypothetical protein
MRKVGSDFGCKVSEKHEFRVLLFGEDFVCSVYERVSKKKRDEERAKSRRRKRAAHSQFFQTIMA